MNEQKAEPSQKMSASEKKAKALEVLKDQMVPVNVRIFQPYVDFIQEYLKFFNSQYSVEDFCRSAVCDTVKRLYRELDKFVDEPQHYVEDDALFKKWPFLSIFAVDDEREDGDEENEE